VKFFVFRDGSKSRGMAAAKPLKGWAMAMRTRKVQSPDLAVDQSEDYTYCLCKCIAKYEFTPSHTPLQFRQLFPILPISFPLPRP